ncbi:MAG TPA: tetratricopeptide repeat protein [Candidatus Acidoferrales bacterium]|nr:tetratricopeptide repeat protein [Candidatus Acidoferrales bacterium]
MTTPRPRIALTAFSILFAAAALSTSAARADASGAIQAAEHQFNAGNYAGAISTLQAAVSPDPSSAEAYYWLGRSYYELHDYDTAIVQADKSVTLDPKSSLYHQWLGRIYGGKADRDRSFSSARKVKSEFLLAVSLDPSNIAARRDLEEYCLDAPWIAGGSKDEALVQVNAIAALDPLAGHLARAVYDREALKKPDEAESEIRQVLNAKLKTTDPYFEVAGFFQTLNKSADMAAAIDAAAQVSPNDPRLAYYRGVQAVLANQNLPGAERDLKSYLASTPDRSDWPAHAAAREWLGRLYESQGKPGAAAEQYRAALQLDPKRKEARARLQKLEKSS